MLVVGAQIVAQLEEGREARRAAVGVDAEVLAQVVRQIGHSDLVAASQLEVEAKVVCLLLVLLVLLLSLNSAILRRIEPKFGLLLQRARLLVHRALQPHHVEVLVEQVEAVHDALAVASRAHVLEVDALCAVVHPHDRVVHEVRMDARDLLNVHRLQDVLVAADARHEVDFGPGAYN